MPTLIDLHYLPNIAYFQTIARADEVILERHEHFVKQTYRNRCLINAANGPTTLIIPLSEKHGNTPVTSLRIDYSQKWLNNHWRAIQSAYGNAPFFEYYADDLHRVLFKRSILLYDLNYELLTMCLAWLKLTVPFKETKGYEKQPLSPVTDLRSVIHPKKELLETFYTPVAYVQVFGKKFVPNLSIIDLVFCQGPGARPHIFGNPED
jgi:hypothetical protein